MNETNTPENQGGVLLRLASTDQLGQADPEREAFEAWFGAPARGLDRLGDGYALSSAHATWKAWQAAQAAARTKALQDAARWVDEEVGHALQDGWSVEAVQALMATRDMLKAHADMRKTTVEVKA